MDNHANALTPTQWSVMELLWQYGALTGREATERMEEKMGWNRSTTLTHLRRMEEKGMVRSSDESGTKTFFPALRREDAVLQETESFLDRVYHGSVSMMLSAMTRKQTLPQEEIDQLYALLEEMEGNSHDRMDR